MKIILSRKGFDSQNGKCASPILPDGTLLSLPIPSDDDITFSDIKYNGEPYYDLIKKISPKTKILPNTPCHLDPDLRKNAMEGRNDWMAGFGQCGGPLTHFAKTNGVGKGDIFLFFGLYKQYKSLFAENKSHKYLSERKGNLHIIYGYMQIGDIYTSKEKIPCSLKNHPHNSERFWIAGNNAIYVPSDKLSFALNKPGYGCFSFNEKLVLTKKGFSCSKWELPDFFRDINISHHSSASWKDGGYFQSAPIGQEFVFEANFKAIEWVKSFFEKQ